MTGTTFFFFLVATIQLFPFKRRWLARSAYEGFEFGVPDAEETVAGADAVAGAVAGTDAGADAGADTGASAGADAGADAGAEIDAGVDTKVRVGPDVGVGVKEDEIAEDGVRTD